MAWDVMSSNGRRNGGVKTLPVHLTDCKLCKLPIFRGQETVWLSKPMGLSHKECA
jgi:hypothetical protein